MSQVVTPTEAGWRPDPSGRYEWRYWDDGWTNRVANTAPAGTTPTTDAAPAPPVPTPAPAPAPAAAAPTVAAPSTAAPESEAAVAVAAAVAASQSSRDTVARAPFGEDTGPVPAPAAPAAPARRRRRTPWVVIVDFLKSFADEPESYHSDLAREPLPSSHRGEQMVNAPGNYGRAGLTALAACGIVAGAYLPWLSGTIGISHFQRTGFDDGLGLGYGIGAAALAISALLSVRMRVFRWLTVVLSFVIAGFVVRDLLNTYDAMQKMNQVRSVSANVGWGLWMMIISAAIAMIASVRLSEDE